jgi:oxalate decarboxylase/phosphoglucose isomerase-like protein (cupin superfamily)
MKLNSTNINGKVIKCNGIYTVIDNTHLKHLVLSQTVLHVAKETTGHYHEGQEEIYFFMYGSGRMIVGDKEFEVAGGDIVLIPDGLFHKVVNTGVSDLIFNCVFEGNRFH